MSGYLGLVELVLVFALVLGAGVWELRKVRRDTRAAAERAAATGDDQPPKVRSPTGTKNAEQPGSKRHRRR